MRSEREIREHLRERKEREPSYDDLEEGAELKQAEKRGYVEALEWVLEARE